MPKLPERKAFSPIELQSHQRDYQSDLIEWDYKAMLKQSLKRLDECYWRTQEKLEKKRVGAKSDPLITDG